MAVRGWLGWRAILGFLDCGEEDEESDADADSDAYPSSLERTCSGDCEVESGKAGVREPEKGDWPYDVVTELSGETCGFRLLT